MIVAVAASGLTLLPGVLRGVPAMNGSARATVLMLVFVTSPRAQWRAHVVNFLDDALGVS